MTEPTKVCDVKSVTVMGSLGPFMGVHVEVLFTDGHAVRVTLSRAAFESLAPTPAPPDQMAVMLMARGSGMPYEEVLGLFTTPRSFTQVEQMAIEHAREIRARMRP